MNKTILSIGAGFPQEEFADAIKERNYNLISIGKGKNSMHVVSKSDLFAEVDTHSFEDVDRWITENNIHFDAAVTICSDFGTQENKVHCFPIDLP